MGAGAEEEPAVRLVVCDTGPLLHLMEIDALQLLNGAGDVLIPDAVDGEVASLVSNWAALRPKWLHIEPLNEQSRLIGATWQASGILHAGEASSLALALQVGGGWYLTDDAAARVVASSLGIEVHGTIGIVLWAAATGLLDMPEAVLLLDALAKSTLWISARVLEEAKSALDVLFAE